MKIIWDDVGAKIYETGLDRGVLFAKTTTGEYGNGVPWNGLTAVNESPSGAEANPIYADNIEYANLVSTEKFGASIEAFTYPKEFEACDGSASPARGVTIGQQKRVRFGLAYRTLIGNDVDDLDHGYKIHLIWNCLAAPSEKGRSTVNESPEAVTFSWEVSTTPVNVAGYKPTSHMTIDSTTTDSEKLKALEALLYGDENTEPKMPTPDEVIELIGVEAAG